MTDTELESQIEAAYRRAMDATDREVQRLAFQEMSALIEKRSPEQVKRLEIVRGLRAP